MILKSLRALNPCEDGLAFAEKHNSLQAAWDKCERGDWLMWLIGRIDRSEPWSEERKPLVACACECARDAWDLMPKASRDALIVLERWTVGKATKAGAAWAAAEAAWAAGAAWTILMGSIR